jgi:DSF synthase
MNNVTYSKNVSIENFNQIKIEVEPEQGIVWLYLRPHPRPCFNTDLIEEVRHFQTMLEYYKGKLPYQGKLVPINYHVVDSLTPGIFNFGGDLAKFFQYIKDKNEEGMYRYGKSCIDTIYPLMTNFNLPITTMTLVRGDALGGGGEVALSSSIIVAERSAQIGFPEILFNMFPGMGAYQMLRRKLNASQAEEMLLNGRIYSAEEMYEMGVVDVLAEDGEGKEAVYEKIKSSQRHRKGMLAMQQVMARTEPVDYDELLDVCKIWVQAAMNLSEKDLKMMSRLVKAQDRKIALAGGTSMEEHKEQQIVIA